MQIETRVFDLSNGKYKSIKELARAMGVPRQNIYKVRNGESPVNQEFIIGALRAFPECTLNELFYVAPDRSQNEHKLGISHEQVGQTVKGGNTPQKSDLNSEAMLRVRDVAYLLNVHINTVRRWSNNGTLKSYHIGSRGDRRFHREDLYRFLRERESEQRPR